MLIIQSPLKLPTVPRGVYCLSLPECLREKYSTSPSYSRRGAEFGLIICSILRLGNGILRPGQSSAKKSVTNNQIYAII
jgi:hypothetical protein